MSPDEFDLRNALREGEGDTVDPDDVITTALAYRHARRVRIGSIAAGVVAAAAIGVGSVALVNDNSGGRRPEAAKSARMSSGQVYTRLSTGAQSRDVRAGAGGAAQPTTRFGTKTAALNCPDAPPRLMLPGGGGTGQFGSTGPLFSGPVDSVKVCVYPEGSAPVSTVVFGADATEVTTSMDAASKLPVPSACVANLSGVTLTVFGVAQADGKVMDPVVVSPCGSVVTNGTAIRYGWSPPPNITQFLDTLPQATTTDGRVSGSPAR